MGTSAADLGRVDAFHTQSYYVHRLSPVLPREAFRPDPSKLVVAAIHVALIVGLCISTRSSSALWLPAQALLVGHSMACLAFFAHDLSHHTVLHHRFSRYAIELVAWGINLVPPTLWRIVHNRTHHANANTLADPDRRPVQNERTFSTFLYTKLFYPSAESLKWNPLVLIHFVPYILRNLAAALFYPGSAKPHIVPSKPSFSFRQRVVILFEAGLIAVIQVAIYHLVGKSLAAYLFVGPIAMLTASAVVMFYVFTNHFLSPITNTADPLETTASLQVPRWLDLLHSNFSYHTEHHVFPGVNSKYYPELGRYLQEHFPDRYTRLSAREAWQKLWSTSQYEILQAGGSSEIPTLNESSRSEGVR